jgi:hypothetical protein
MKRQILQVQGRFYLDSGSDTSGIPGYLSQIESVMEIGSFGTPTAKRTGSLQTNESAAQL